MLNSLRLSSDPTSEMIPCQQLLGRVLIYSLVLRSAQVLVQSTVQCQSQNRREAGWKGPPDCTSRPVPRPRQDQPCPLALFTKH